jgi:HIRAN domain
MPQGYRKMVIRSRSPRYDLHASLMTLTAIVIGTGLRNADGSSRSRVIRRQCVLGGEVVLRRGPATGETSHAVAVYLVVPRLFGLLRSSYAQIGYLDSHAAASIAARLDTGSEVRARVKSVYAPEEKDSPRVSLVIE